MNRRSFLKLSGTFFATATLSGLPGCGGDDGASEGTYSFPQGVASGDPDAESVILWTRVIAVSEATDPIGLVVEVATDADFTSVVVSQEVTAATDSDFTVRVVVDGLAANTIYFYRFTAGVDTISGRTRTAPAADADVPVRLAWVSCQDYQAGAYAAYRQMIADDEAAAADAQLHFVLFLGDFIYETRGDAFQGAVDENFGPTDALNDDGSPRRVAAFPSGGGAAGSSQFARTVDDYRHLYKTFLSDPDLQEARARWPFISIWDDHEFSNDYWQSQANYTDANSTDEPSQSRKVASNQAWAEFIPARLAAAFAPTTVSDAPFTAPNADNFVDEPNNAAAVASLTIYRTLRWGRHVDLVLTDQRSYRSDHAVPEEFSAGNFVYLDPRNVLPAGDVDILDAGSTYNNNTPPDTIGSAPNPRKNSPPGTMLGATQKAWFKQQIESSTATWRIWGNEVPYMRFFIPQQPVGALLTDRLMDGDAWDGYPSERKELGAFFASAGVSNLIILTGDIHAQFGGLVYDDFTSATPTTVGVELSVAGISSNSLFSFFEGASRGSGIPADVRALVTYDASAFSSGGPRFRENMNLLLLHGTASADKMAETNDLSQALAVSSPANPHLKYADTNSQGYGVLRVDATQAVGELVTVERPLTADVGVKRRATFTIPKDNPAAMTGPEITGTKPFPLA